MHSEYLHTPCEVAPERRQGRAADLCDMAMVLTVERCYPGAIDEALETWPDDYDTMTITRFIKQKYTDALLDFGFAQARGLELGLLGRSVLHCERKAGNACYACPLTSLYEDFSERIAALKALAVTRNIRGNEFMQLYRWSIEAAAALPEANVQQLATENALALLTHEC